MNHFKKLPYLLVPVAALTLASCGGDSSDNNDDSEQPAQLSIGVTDAPVDDAMHVYVEFSGVTLIRAGVDDDDENDDDSDDDNLIITFDENHRIDLLAYQY